MGETKRHSSTVTVALVEGGATAKRALDMAEVDIETYRGSGPGGQHRNTSDTAVRARHRPTGLVAKSEAQRSWWQNQQAAVAELERRVQAQEAAGAAAALNDARVDQIGVGGREERSWTWTSWRDSVTHHPTGRSWRMSAMLQGRW